MSTTAEPNGVVTTVLSGADTGIAAGLTVGLIDSSSNVLVAQDGTGITEIAAGLYQKVPGLNAPANAGIYFIMWQLNGNAYASEDLTVNEPTSEFIDGEPTVDLELKPNGHFPPGSTVDVFEITTIPGSLPPEKMPPVSPARENVPVASDGTIALANLPFNTGYLAAAMVDGVFRHLRFETSEPGEVDTQAQMATLTAQVSGESAIRAQADSDEATARIAADNSEQTAREDADDAEVAARTAADLRIVNYPIYLPEDLDASAGSGGDDTASLQGALDAALSAGKDAELVLDSTKTYLVNGPLVTSRGGNSILSYAGAGSYPNAKVSIVAGNKGPRVHNSPQAIIKTTKTGVTLGSNGPPSVLGGKTDENGRTPSSLPSMGFLYTRGVKIIVPDDPTLAGLDAYDVGGIDTDIHVITQNMGTITDPATHTWAFGLRVPEQVGSANINLDHPMVGGMYAAFVITCPDHVWWNGLYAFKCVAAWCFQDPLQGGHSMPGGFGFAEWCQYDFVGWTPSAGVGSLASGTKAAFIQNLTVDTEPAPGGTLPNFAKQYTILDANNMLYGNMDVLYYGGGGGGIPVDTTFGPIIGGTNLKLTPARYGAGNLTAADHFAFPKAADVHFVAGNTTINSLGTARPGRVVSIIFSDSPIVTHNVGAAPPAGYDRIYLRGSHDLQASPNLTLTLVHDGFRWQEVGRKEDIASNITGSRNANAALANLLGALESRGFIVNNTTP